MQRIEATLLVQRWHRGLAVRKALRAKRDSSITSLAKSLSARIGGVIGGLIDNVLLAPVNMASETLINALLGNMLSIFVKGYSKSKPIPIKTSSAGIEIGGPEGLHLDDEALAVLMDGMSLCSNVFISSVRLRLPMLHNRLEVHLDEVRATITSMPRMLSAARKAELEKLINSMKPKDTAAKQAPSAAAATDDNATRDDDYGAINRATDGVYARIRSIELTVLQGAPDRAAFADKPTPSESAPLLGGDRTPAGSVATPRTTARQAFGRLRMARSFALPSPPPPLPTSSCTLGCVSCTVRWPRWLSARRAVSAVAAQARRLTARGGDGAAEQPVEVRHSVCTVIKLEDVELQNCKPDFSQSHRLVTQTVQRARDGGLFGGLFGVGKPPAHETADHGAQLHIFKRLIVRKVHVHAVTTTHGVRVPVVQPIELAILVHAARWKRTGKLLGVDVDCVLPDASLGWLIDSAAQLHGRMRMRTEPSPLDARARPHRSGALGVAARDGADGAPARDELVRWRAHVAALLVKGPSTLSPFDAHVRACLERYVSRRTLLIVAREHKAAARGARRGGVAAGARALDTQARAGALLWRSPERAAGKPMPINAFVALLHKYEIILAADALEYALAQQGARERALVDVGAFLERFSRAEDVGNFV